MHTPPPPLPADYDQRAVRISAIDTWGGPVDGGTWVRLSGRVLSDFRRQHGELSTSDELIPYADRGERSYPHAHTVLPPAQASARSCDCTLLLTAPYCGPRTHALRVHVLVVVCHLQVRRQVRG